MSHQAKTKRRWNAGAYPKMVTVRVTNEEHAEIQRRSAQARLSDSRFLAKAGLGLKMPPVSDRPRPTPEERRELEFLLYELRKVGVNLNQLARRANTARLVRRMPPPRSKVDHAAGAVEGLVRLIRKRL